jgi:hypothetical protein
MNLKQIPQFSPSHSIQRHLGETAMNQTAQPHTSAWVSFSYASFLAAGTMVGAGLLFLPLDWWAKGYLAMGVVMLVQSTVTLTKTLRDNHEASRMVNRIEDARAEQLLMRVKSEP